MTIDSEYMAVIRTEASLYLARRSYRSFADCMLCGRATSYSGSVRISLIHWAEACRRASRGEDHTTPTTADISMCA